MADVVTPELARQAPKPIRLDITIDDGNEEELPNAIAQLVERFLRAQAERAGDERSFSSCAVTSERLGTATTNIGFRSAVRLRFDNDGEQEQLYFVRIFGAGTEFLYDRQREMRVMEAASAWGLGPRLYAEFNNGIIAQFLHGRELVTHEVRSADMAARIAREAARWHRIPPQRIFKGDTERQLVTGNSLSTLRKWIERADQLLDTRDALSRSSRSEEIVRVWGDDWPLCKAEIARLIRSIQAHWISVYGSEDAAPLVFSHNDLTPGNIFLLDGDDDSRFLFVDVETASLNYPGFDLGNFCNEWCGVMSIDWSKFPSDAQQRAFVTEYLRVRFACEPSEQQLDNFLVEVRYFSLFSNLFWCVWGIVQACSSHITTFSHLDYSRIRWQRYLDVKHEFVLVD